jgi:hypothetical protein
MNVGSVPRPLPGRGNHMIVLLMARAYMPGGHFLRLSWRTPETSSLLDFSHLQAKGIEIRCSPQCPGSADQGAHLLSTMMIRSSSLRPTFLRTSLPITAGSLQGDFLRVVAADRHAKSPKAFYEGLTDAVCYTAKWLKSSSEGVRKASYTPTAVALRATEKLLLVHFVLRRNAIAEHQAHN